MTSETAPSKELSTPAMLAWLFGGPALALLGLVCLNCLFGSASVSADTRRSGTVGSRQPEEFHTISQKLAVIETSDRSAVHSDLADRFDRKLSSLEAKFPEGRHRIADMTVKAQELLQEKGNTEGLYSIMHAVDSSVPGRLGISYAEAAAMYVTLRNGRR